MVKSLIRAQRRYRNKHKTKHKQQAQHNKRVFVPPPCGHGVVAQVCLYNVLHTYGEEVRYSYTVALVRSSVPPTM